MGLACRCSGDHGHRDPSECCFCELGRCSSRRVCGRDSSRLAACSTSCRKSASGEESAQGLRPCSGECGHPDRWFGLDVFDVRRAIRPACFPAAYGKRCFRQCDHGLVPTGARLCISADFGECSAQISSFAGACGR